MQVDPVIQQTTDFDWFGVDEEGLLGYFTTAGFKLLPRSVAGSAEDLNLVTDYFKMHADVLGSHRVDDENLKNALNREWKGEHKETRYLRDFISMADKGLFSYDIGSHLNPGISYFRVASPQIPLTLEDLPEHIRQIVSRTILKGLRLKNESHVPYEATVEF